jgi:hypothetical protein
VRGRVSLKQTTDPAAFERANYIRALQSWKSGPQEVSRAP